MAHVKSCSNGSTSFDVPLLTARLHVLVVGMQHVREQSDQHERHLATHSADNKGMYGTMMRCITLASIPSMTVMQELTARLQC